MKRQRILIVEDETIVAKDLELTLEHLGYEVIGNFDNGQDAYKAALEKKPDLLLMDIFLKGEMDGIETSNRIKTELNIPVVFLSAFSDELTLKRAKETKPHGYITKPFEEKDLYITVEMVLNKSKLENELETEKQKTFLLEQKARELAEQENRTKDLILTTLSHESRTPLVNILAWTDILQSNPTPENLEIGLKIIERNAKAQSMLVNDLLDVSSMVFGKMKVNKEKMSFYEVLEIAISSIKPFAQDQSIEFKTVFLAKEDEILGDPLRLQQILWNLFQNALKFTSKNGEITVTVHNQKLASAGTPSIVFEVKDTGQGIPAEMLDKIFERFYQVPGSKKGGLGLGLSIVKELVHLHQGTIEAKSEGFGTGARFIIELPLYQFSG
ncbi:MAG: hybrid sensor histidine kinase/response regulator [Pseudobdellovibrionaceae bacterium]